MNIGSNDYYLTPSQPLFKFLSDIHGQELLTKGNIKIGTIHEFRKTGDGNIKDPNEGKFDLINHYTIFKGNPTDAFGLLKKKYIDQKHIEVQDETIPSRIDLPNHNIYSTSRFLLTQSFIQSIEDGKKTCVMIKEPEPFFNAITKHFGFEDGLLRGCDYRSRILVEQNPTKDSETEKLLKNLLALAYIKPLKYSTHYESRILWQNTRNKNISVKIEDISVLSNYCIQIDVKGIRKDALTKPKKRERVKIETILKDKEEATFTIAHPFMLFTPIIFRRKGKDRDLLGYAQPLKNRSIEMHGASFNGGLGSGVTISTGETDWFVLQYHYLDKIKKIIMTTYEEPYEKPKEGGFTYLPGPDASLPK